jgi:hypothetical protein
MHEVGLLGIIIVGAAAHFVLSVLPVRGYDKFVILTR